MSEPGFFKARSALFFALIASILSAYFFYQSASTYLALTWSSLNFFFPFSLSLYPFIKVVNAAAICSFDLPAFSLSAAVFYFFFTIFFFGFGLGASSDFSADSSSSSSSELVFFGGSMPPLFSIFKSAGPSELSSDSEAFSFSDFSSDLSFSLGLTEAVFFDSVGVSAKSSSE